MSISRLHPRAPTLPAPSHGASRSHVRGSCIAAAIAFSLPAAANAACEAQTLELSVKMVGSRAVATVGINGTPVPLTVDSGAYFSGLTEAAARQLQLPLKLAPGLHVEGITGRVDTYTTRVDRLKLVKGEVPRVEFIVGGNEPGAGTMGLMGRNMLSFTDTEYDLAHGEIRFVIPSEGCAKANMAYWAGTAPVSVVDLLSTFGEATTPPIRTRVKLNGIEMVALLDTGATTVVTAQAARRAGVAESAWNAAGKTYGAGRGSAKAWTAPFDSFEIGSEVIRNNRLHVADFLLDDADVLLGIDFFLSHHIYVSKQQTKMYFTYGGGAVFALDKSEAAASEPALGAGGTDALTADQLARRSAASASRRDYDSALADLNRALVLEPASAALLAQRGAVFTALRQPKPALQDYDQALQLDANQVEARARRAALRVRAKDLEGARADLAVLDQTIAPQSAMRLSMGHLYLALDQPKPAIAQFDAWLAAHPSEARRDGALNARCWARVRLGVELDRALDDCNDAIDADAGNAAYYDSRGWLYLRRGQYQQAVDDFSRSVERQPKSAWSLFGRGLARGRLGDAAQGEADLAAARKLEPDVDATLARTGLGAAAAPAR